MSNTIFKITFEGELMSEIAEQMEDKLAAWLSRQGFTGKIDDSTTGNTTTFEYKPPTTPGAPRWFNPQPKPEKRR